MIKQRMILQRQLQDRSNPEIVFYRLNWVRALLARESSNAIFIRYHLLAMRQTPFVE
jgi:hypothetical protein